MVANGSNGLKLQCSIVVVRRFTEHVPLRGPCFCGSHTPEQTLPTSLRKARARTSVVGLPNLAPHTLLFAACYGLELTG